MRRWWHGRRGAALVLAGISLLVVGGLGWASAAALNLEWQQQLIRAQVEFDERLRLAMWRLDSRVMPFLAREDTRPYSQYTAVFAPPFVMRQDGKSAPAGTVLEPSPLLTAPLPEWMLLHFQVDDAGWRSPQVVSTPLRQRLDRLSSSYLPGNATPAREALLRKLAREYPPAEVLAAAQRRLDQPGLAELALQPGPNTSTANSLALNQAQVLETNALNNSSPVPPQAAANEYLNRAGQASQLRSQKSTQVESGAALDSANRSGEPWAVPAQLAAPAGQLIELTLNPLLPLWLSGHDCEARLFAIRQVHVGPRLVCQGIALDWQRLSTLLREDIQDLFPAAEFRPLIDEVPPHPERTMTALPVELLPGSAPENLGALGWSPLYLGLGLAWAATLAALATVALGGWSLVDLSERRIRFVSAVTHELRTPLTTLRLYLDMLAGGMVRDPAQQAEYLNTLNSEADRLHRLISNVLDYSRLENQRPQLSYREKSVAAFLEQVREAYDSRCRGAEKELVVENLVGAAVLCTDLEMAQQILGNLIDNACKYSRGAADARVWLRVRETTRGWLSLELEDRGPGVPARERRAVFRLFHRGLAPDPTISGVGLGLALAQRWATLLGGRLTLEERAPATGACFRLELPPAAWSRAPATLS